MFKKIAWVVVACVLGISVAFAFPNASGEAASTENKIYLPVISRASPIVLTDIRTWSTRCCLFIKGMATNLSGSVTYSVAIEATFLSYKTGHEFTREAYLYLPAILPGQTSPFSIYYNEYYESFISARVTGYYIPDAAYVPLTIVSRSFNSCTPYGSNIVGVVRNDSGVAIEMPAGALWRYSDPSWWYHEIAQLGFVATTLQPGEETTYIGGWIYCYGSPPPDEELQYYTIVAQGKVIP